MKQDKQYWMKRCELAEKYIDAEAGDASEWAYIKWQGFVNHSTSLPWFDAPPPPKKVHERPVICEAPTVNAKDNEPEFIPKEAIWLLNNDGTGSKKDFIFLAIPVGIIIAFLFNHC